MLRMIPKVKVRNSSVNTTSKVLAATKLPWAFSAKTRSISMSSLDKRSSCDFRMFIFSETAAHQSAGAMPKSPCTALPSTSLRMRKASFTPGLSKAAVSV